MLEDEYLHGIVFFEMAFKSGIFGGLAWAALVLMAQLAFETGRHAFVNTAHLQKLGILWFAFWVASFLVARVFRPH